MLNGIRYLWQDKEKSFDNGNYQDCDNREVSVISYHNINKTKVPIYDYFFAWQNQRNSFIHDKSRV